MVVDLHFLYLLMFELSVEHFRTTRNVIQLLFVWTTLSCIVLSGGVTIFLAFVELLPLVLFRAPALFLCKRVAVPFAVDVIIGRSSSVCLRIGACITARSPLSTTQVIFVRSGVKSLQEFGTLTGKLLMHIIFGFSLPIIVFADIFFLRYKIEYVVSEIVKQKNLGAHLAFLIFYLVEGGKKAFVVLIKLLIDFDGNKLSRLSG